MYCIGDLVKWMGGGIEYIGWIDQQVKVCGYWIEFLEIEVQFVQFFEVQDVVVIVVKDKGGNIVIVVYVILELVDIEVLKLVLKEILLDYMILVFWVMLNEFLVMVNGKVDCKVLFELDIEVGSGEYKVLMIDMEELFVGIWQDVFGMFEVGVIDNFFLFGGDFIKGI